MDRKKGFREEIISFGRLLYARGLVAGMDGNISVRTDGGGFLVTASGVHKGLLEEKHIIEVDRDGSIISGFLKPSSEIMLHLETYRKIPDCSAIIHAHAPWSIAASLNQNIIDLNLLAEGRLLFGKVEVIPYREPGSRELAELSSDAAMRAKIHILKAHGVVAWGQNLMEAFCLIEALEQNIKIIGISRTDFS